MIHSLRKVGVLVRAPLLLLLVSTAITGTPSAAQPQAGAAATGTSTTDTPATGTSATDAADALYAAQKWPEAARAYAEITRAQPANGRAWYRLGVSLHQSGQFQAAVAAYERSLATGEGPPKAFVLYNLAAAHARLGDKEEALHRLAEALGAPGGAALGAQLRGDEDFASLRNDRRFEGLLVTADRAAKPCMSSPQSRQLDFWVGEWDVLVRGQKVGTNDVQRLEDGCVVMEHWMAAGGQTGISLNFYNPVTGKWRQTYVGNNLGIWEMSGELREGAMRYEGELFGPQGATTTRMTFFDLGPDKVRQLGENSADGGKTWTVVWDATYVRKAGSRPAS